MRNDNPKILLIAGTHGNEKIGLEIIEILKTKGLEKKFDFLLGNPQALQKNVRYLEKDLNRSYPGKKNSKLLEKRLAFKNLLLAKKYDYVIDIHEASAGINDFIIIPQEKLSEKFPIKLLKLKTILLWPQPKGSISGILKNSLELEFGMKNRDRKKVIQKAARIVENFLLKITAQKTPPKTSEKKIFYVYDKLMTDEIKNEEMKKLKDFRKFSIQNETFYPLLVGQYLSDGILCYKMKKII